MGLHHHLLAIIVCYQKPLLDEWLTIFQLIFDWKFTMYINSNSKTNVNHMNWSFRFGETIFFPRKFVVGFETFSALNFSADDWKQSEKKPMLIHVKVAVSHHSRCWSWSSFIYMKKTAIDFPLGGNCRSSWGMETRFTNNTTPCVGFNSNIRGKQKFFY